MFFKQREYCQSECNEVTGILPAPFYRPVRPPSRDQGFGEKRKTKLMEDNKEKRRGKYLKSLEEERKSKGKEGSKDLKTIEEKEKLLLCSRMTVFSNPTSGYMNKSHCTCGGN